MIELSNDEERQEIDWLFSQYKQDKDTSALKEYGIEILPDTSQVDCAGNALARLGFPSRADLISLIVKEKNEVASIDQLDSGLYIARYYLEGQDEPMFKNTAAYVGDSVLGPMFESKWGSDLAERVIHPWDKIKSSSAARLRLFKVDRHQIFAYLQADQFSGFPGY